MQEQETQTRVDIDMDALEREVMLSYLPESLDLTHRCDKCGAAAHHAWVLPTGGGFTVMTFCNHHGRDVREKLSAYPHKDYRMTLDEAAAVNAAALKAMEVADREASTKRNSDAVNAEYRPVPHYLTQWDWRQWA